MPRAACAPVRVRIRVRARVRAMARVRVRVIFRVRAPCDFTRVGVQA